jgi:hypothetical protein
VGRTATIIAVSYTAASAIAIVFMVYVAASTRSRQTADAGEVHLRRWGTVLAALTWWLMVIGVGGVVVTCLVFKYGGSWVFLYPISFHSAGVWGRWTWFFFSFSVLLVGLAIVTWCLAILDTRRLRCRAGRGARWSSARARRLAVATG